MNKALIRDHLKLYLVMGSVNCNLAPELVLEQGIQGGVTIFQFREKGQNALVGEERIQLGQRLRELCASHDIPFIVNDDLELALALNADGLHIGQEDGSVQEARRHLGEGRWLGVSAHDESEAVQAVKEGADYLGVGPIYPTLTKLDARQVQGPSVIQRIRQQLPSIPIVGIGGITENNGHEVLKAGADGLAVVSAITQSTDPCVAARSLRKLHSFAG